MKEEVSNFERCGFSRAVNGHFLMAKHKWADQVGERPIFVSFYDLSRWHSRCEPVPMKAADQVPAFYTAARGWEVL